MHNFLTRHFDADWPTHSMLLWAGVMLYFALAGTMLHAIAVLSHSGHDAALGARATRPQPIALSLTAAAVAIPECVTGADEDLRACAAQQELQRAMARLKRRDARVLSDILTGTTNLLWAPPGSVLLAADETGDLHASAQMPVLASR